MKTVLILFAIMYLLGEIVNLTGYWVYNHYTIETLGKIRGNITNNMLAVNARYINGKDYVKWAIIGAPLRFICGPISMIGIIGVFVEWLIYNRDIL